MWGTILSFIAKPVFGWISKYTLPLVFVAGMSVTGVLWYMLPGCEEQAIVASVKASNKAVVGLIEANADRKAETAVHQKATNEVANEKPNLDCLDDIDLGVFNSH